MAGTKDFKNIISVFLIISVMGGLTVPLYSAGKKPKKKTGKDETPVKIEKPKTEEKSETETTEDDKTVIPILDSAKKKTFFSSIDSEILSLVEIGTPEALQQAMSKIRKNEFDYTDIEKILIQIATEIMEACWTNQKITWQNYEVFTENAYTAAIQSAKKGVFDSSTGNTDFFTTLLPAFVILYPATASNISEYYTEIENALLASQDLNSDSVLPKYLLGLFYERTGDFTKALPYLNSAFDQTKGCFDASLAYARVLTSSGNAEQAGFVLQKILMDYPSNLRILKQAAFTSFAKRDFVAAEEYVARVLQQTPNDLEFVLFRAKIFVEKKDYIHAGSLLDMYSKQDDSSLDYLLLRTKVQLDWSRNTTAATETIEKTLQKYPSDPNALMLAARISSITDSPVAGKYADELAAMVLEIDPENRDARIYALEGLMQRENWLEAYLISKQLMTFGNPDSQLIFNHIKNCIKTGQKNEALELAQNFYSQNPSDELIGKAYIYAYTNSDKKADALEIINTMLADPTTKLKSYLYYSRSFLQPNDDSALADLRSCLIASPRNTEALFRLYEIYFSKEDYRKAQYYLRQVVAINPNDNSLKKLNEALTQLIK